MPSTIHKVTGEDLDKFIALIRVFEAVFETPNLALPSREHLQKLLRQEDFIVLAAEVEGRVIGGLTAYVLTQYYSPQPLAYLYDLAVQPDFQRQGIGRQLVATLIQLCADQGFGEVFVQADEADVPALDFYRSTSITAENEVRHFCYKLSSQAPK